MILDNIRLGQPDADMEQVREAARGARIMILKDVIGNYINFLKEGDSALVMTYDGKILTIKENSSVNLEVVEAEDAVRGNTSNSATKTVTLETGYKVNVPLFIRKGDIVKVNTETGECSGKAN